MSIDDYRKIMLCTTAQTSTVECYDPTHNRPIKVKMYFATEEMAKLYTIALNRLLPNGQWEEWVDLVGVTEYKVELIGTNNDLDLVSVANTMHRLRFTNSPRSTYARPIRRRYLLGRGNRKVGSNSTFPDTATDNSQFKHWVDVTGLNLQQWCGNYSKCSALLFMRFKGKPSTTQNSFVQLRDFRTRTTPSQTALESRFPIGKFSSGRALALCRNSQVDNQ